MGSASQLVLETVIRVRSSNSNSNHNMAYANCRLMYLVGPYGSCGRWIRADHGVTKKQKKDAVSAEPLRQQRPRMRRRRRHGLAHDLVRAFELLQIKHWRTSPKVSSLAPLLSTEARLRAKADAGRGHRRPEAAVLKDADAKHRLW